MDIKREKLDFVAKELNEVLELNPIINFESEIKDKTLIEDIKDVFENTLETGDKLSNEAIEIFVLLGLKETLVKIEETKEISEKTKDVTQSKKKKIGVIATIVKCIEAGPINKNDILEILIKDFPERQKQSMKKTINVQVPNRIKKEKNDSLFKDENDKWSFAKKK